MYSVNIFTEYVNIYYWVARGEFIVHILDKSSKAGWTNQLN